MGFGFKSTIRLRNTTIKKRDRITENALFISETSQQTLTRSMSLLYKLTTINNNLNKVYLFINLKFIYLVF